MARATQTITTATQKAKKRKTGSSPDTMPCNVCGGTGRQKKPSKKSR